MEQRGEFEASFEAELEGDPLRTAVEIDASGIAALERLIDIVQSGQPEPVDVALVQAIHRWWFETTFPVDAGRLRMGTVVNKKGTAVPWEAVLPGVDDACQSWNWRRSRYAPTDTAQALEFTIREANQLAVVIYDIHPFIDGNTRMTWHLRNYALMLDAIRPLRKLRDRDAYEAAWQKAGSNAHDDLDAVVLAELTNSN